MGPDRRCIKCPEHPVLVRQKVDNIDVDLCPACRGLWLDRDEIFQLSTQSDGALDELREMVKAEAEGEPMSPSIQPCPACGGKMSLASFGSFHVEHCIPCGGIFLDRGELERVLQTAKSKKIATVVGLARSVVVSGGTKS
jgi:Zn-finger nucleic acid-binding protein